MSNSFACHCMFGSILDICHCRARLFWLSSTACFLDPFILNPTYFDSPKCRRTINSSTNSSPSASHLQWLSERERQRRTESHVAWMADWLNRKHRQGDAIVRTTTKKYGNLQLLARLIAEKNQQKNERANVQSRLDWASWMEQLINCSFFVTDIHKTSSKSSACLYL